jgi:hypothetical protein
MFMTFTSPALTRSSGPILFSSMGLERTIALHHARGQSHDHAMTGVQ